MIGVWLLGKVVAGSVRGGRAGKSVVGSVIGVSGSI